MQRITEFEGLRAILAWWVVWGHLLQNSGFVNPNAVPIPVSWLLANGYAVDLFIILSGFVIFLLLDSNPNKTYFQFMAERFFRIYPLFILTLIAGLLLTPIKVSVFGDGGWHDLEFAGRMLARIGYEYDYFVVHIISHLTLLQGLIPDQLVPDSSVAFLGPAWSLSLEWQFYLVAPLLILCVRRSLLLSFLIVLTAAVVNKLLFLAELDFGYGSFLIVKFKFFVVGILSYYACKFSQTHSSKVRQFFPFLSTSLIIITILCIYSPSRTIVEIAIPMTIWLITLSVVLARLVQINFLPFKAIETVLNHPLLQQLGRVSYSTYLAHIPIFLVLMWAFMQFNPDVQRGAMLMFLGLVGSVVVTAISFVLYYRVEKPCMQFGKQMSKQMTAKTIPI
ncbi:MAG TPA: acyltransferase [Crinalium sp.]|jgi:peptidoglycan/LPS O-acetylase OafA/YrhL